MSRETEEALREAIIAHSRDAGGGGETRVPADWLLGDWAVATHWIDPAEDMNFASYMRISPDGQHYHRTMGLFNNALEDALIANVKRDG